MTTTTTTYDHDDDEYTEDEDDFAKDEQRPELDVIVDDDDTFDDGSYSSGGGESFSSKITPDIKAKGIENDDGNNEATSQHGNENEYDDYDDDDDVDNDGYDSESGDIKKDEKYDDDDYDENDYDSKFANLEDEENYDDDDDDGGGGESETGDISQPSPSPHHHRSLLEEELENERTITAALRMELATLKIESRNEDDDCEDSSSSLRRVEDELQNERSLTASLRDDIASLEQRLRDERSSGSSATTTAMGSNNDDDDDGGGHTHKDVVGGSCGGNDDNGAMPTVCEKLCETSRKLVKEGEKNIKLALQIEKNNNDLDEMKRDIRRFRRALLQGINGGISDIDNYRHVSLDELLRLRLQESSLSSSLSDSSHNPTPRKVRMGTTTTAATQQPNENDANDNNTTTATLPHSSSITAIQKLEKELRTSQHQNATLRRKNTDLLNQLRTQSASSAETLHLKRKITHMVERSRRDKQHRAQLTADDTLSQKKIHALSHHVEKLMAYLQREATLKARATYEMERTKRELSLSKKRNVVSNKRNGRKDRMIVELTEGGKILEDQLRLMDEKYMELRLKLDWTRGHMERVVKKKEDEAQQLRAKFALMTSLGGGDMMGDGKGSMPLLDEYEFGGTTTAKKKKEEDRTDDAATTKWKGGSSKKKDQKPKK